MNLLIIGLVAALIIAVVIVANSSKKVKEEVPEPSVKPNFSVEIEDPAAPVPAQEEVLLPEKEVVVSQEVVSADVLDKKKVKKSIKDSSAKKTAKPVAKTSAKLSSKKTVVKKNK